MNIRKLYLSILLILGIFFTLSAQEATIDKSYLDETDLYNEAFFLVSLQDTFRFVRNDDSL